MIREINLGVVSFSQLTELFHRTMKKGKKKKKKKKIKLDMRDLVKISNPPGFFEVRLMRLSKPK